MLHYYEVSNSGPLYSKRLKLTTTLTLPYRTRRFSNHESRLLSRAHTFAIIVILDLKIHQSMWIHWSFFPKTWTKGHWPLHDLWPHVCWGHNSTQGSLCPSPMTRHQCMWIQWSILQILPHTYYIHTTYILRTYYVQNEWSHSLLLNSVQARQKGWYYLTYMDVNLLKSTHCRLQCKNII